MSSHPLLIELDTQRWAIHSFDENTWQISNVDASVDQSPDTITDALRTVLKSINYRNEPAVIAVRDEWCLSEPVADSSGKPTQQTMLYALEEMLPIAAEDVVADFLQNKSPTLGICVDLAHLRTPFDILRSASVNIKAICPRALLALQQRMQTQPAPAGTDLVWQEAQRVHLFHLEDGKPVTWQTGSLDDLSNRLNLYCLNRNEPLAIHIEADSDELKKIADAIPDVSVTGQSDLALEDALRPGAVSIASHQARPWIDLHREPLIEAKSQSAWQKSAGLVLAAIILLAVSISASMLWRAHQYERIAHESLIVQQQVFRDTFKGNRMPPNIRSRMLSEARILQQQMETSSQPPQSDSALVTLVHAMKNIPPSQTLNVIEMRFESNRMRLRGKTDKHGQADQIAAAIRKSEHMNVSPPQTNRTAQGMIDYSISATRIQTTGQEARP